MSRNLAKTKCDHCDHEIELEEEPRPITEQDCGKHFFNEYKGMLVATAHCPMCLAEYLAWIDGTNREQYAPYPNPQFGKIGDLSYRSSFNDEPGNDDLPKYLIQQIVTWHRICKINS